MNMRTIFFIIFLTLCLALSFGQEVKYNTPQAGNPIIPGYFADPTIQKFGDTYYLYATTDGNGGGLGPSQVWTSKDFCELEHTTDELAEYTLYMGTGCNEGKGWQILYVLLPTLPNLLRCI